MEAKMFVVLITYKTDLAVIEKYVVAHRAYLDEGYKNNILIASGPRNPKTGGILLSQLSDKLTLENFLHKDPFFVNDLAEYELIEFLPNKCHPEFQHFLKT
jgi:uncharacterized protein YciI